MKKRIAAVTMTYNEIHKLPRWVDHYERQIGNRADLFVIDHGSSDNSTQNLGAVNVHHLDRPTTGGITQAWRADYVSEFCNNLLDAYDFVIYADADELVFPAIGKGSSLYEYVSSAKQVRGSAIGFDVLHDTRTEGPLDPQKRVFEQRTKLQLVGAMCKTLLTSSPIRWAQGFHCSSHTPAFGDLILAHLRYADAFEGIERLNITRSLVRPDHANSPCDHQKISDDTYLKWLNDWAALPVKESTLDLGDDYIQTAVEKFVFTAKDGIHSFDYSLRSRTLLSPVAALRSAA